MVRPRKEITKDTLIESGKVTHLRPRAPSHLVMGVAEFEAGDHARRSQEILDAWPIVALGGGVDGQLVVLGRLANVRKQRPLPEVLRAAHLKNNSPSDQQAQRYVVKDEFP